MSPNSGKNTRPFPLPRSEQALRSVVSTLQMAIIAMPINSVVRPRQRYSITLPTLCTLSARRHLSDRHVPAVRFMCSGSGVRVNGAT